MQVLLVLLALVGAPLFTIIAAGALIGFGSRDLEMVVALEFFELAETPVLVAIPLFTFAGFVLSEGRAPRRIVDLSEALLGWLPGGLAMIALAACALFTAFTGASGVTIIALGALLYPALGQAGYDERFSLGLITASGSLGLLFAPSLPIILYGVIAQAPIDELFIAGILPGTLMVMVLAAYSYWVNRRPASPVPAASARRVWRTLFAARWELPLPVVVLGGIYSGYFAISEAAAVTAVYVICTEFLILREIPLRKFPQIVRESMVLVGAILAIVGMSLASTDYMIDIEVPQRMFEAIGAYVESPFTFLVALLIFLLALGAVLDIFSAIVLVVPIILPVSSRYGIDPIHLGITFLAAMELGYLTPPVGLNLFISSFRFGKDITEVYRATLPFLLALLICVIIIAFVPELSLFLLSS